MLAAEHTATLPTSPRVFFRMVFLLLFLFGCSSNATISSPSIPNSDASTSTDLFYVDSYVPDVQLDEVLISSDANDLIVRDSTISTDTTSVRPGNGPPYPIVLVHGFAGFRDIGPLNYYFRVAERLRSRGNTVYESVTAPFASPDVRGAMLGQYLDTVVFPRTGAAKVILIAHSQGGLDSRYAISSLGFGNRVAALVTISTPHLGTRIADAVNGTIPGVSDVFLNAVATVLGFTYNEARSRADLRAALQALSESNAVNFNRSNANDPRVLYWSYAGRTNGRSGDEQCSGAVIANSSRRDNTALALLPFANFLEQGDSALHVNDGMVEVRSARWGRFMGCVPADHFDEVGQIAHLIPNLESGFDHLAFYEDIVRRLRAEGL
jgi:triacylglycerol lipase